MNPHYETVAERAQYRCEYCRAPESIFNFVFEVEHVFPLSQGGDHDESNLALACRSCNLFKSDHLTGIVSSVPQAVALFHPRRDQWREHFRFELETGLLVGLTDVGLATIQRLQMNRAAQVTARRQWLKLKLYP